MMMTISILVFILFLCCTVFLKGSLLGGILGMALAAGAAALAVLRRRYPQKKLATAGCVLLIAVAAGTGLLFPASGLSEESPAENPLIAQLTEAALSGDLIEGDRLAAEYTAGREKDIAENGAPEFLPADDTVHLLLAQCCLVAGDPAGAEAALKKVADKGSQEYFLQYGELCRQMGSDVGFRNNWLDAVYAYPQWETANLMRGISILDEVTARDMDYVLPTIFFFLGRAYELNPENPYTNCYLGVSNCIRGNYPLALTYLDQATELDDGKDQALSQTIAEYTEFPKKEGKLQ